MSSQLPPAPASAATSTAPTTTTTTATATATITNTPNKTNTTTTTTTTTITTAATQIASATGRAKALFDIRRSVKSRLLNIPPKDKKTTHDGGGGGDDPYDIEAELISRDRTRQKEAVRRYLEGKVRNDWVFEWPPQQQQQQQHHHHHHHNHHHDDAVVLAQEDTVTTVLVLPEPDMDNTDHHQEQSSTPPAQPPNDLLSPAPDPREQSPIDSGAEADSDDTESVYSVMSDDPSQFRPRTEWASDLSGDDDDDDGMVMPGPPPVPVESPFRFDSPDSVGASVQASALVARDRRRRAARDEMAWNQGLACFTARRDAWTGARTVRLKPRPSLDPPATGPLSPRRRDKIFRFMSAAYGAQPDADSVVASGPQPGSAATTPTTASAAPTQTPPLPQQQQQQQQQQPPPPPSGLTSPLTATLSRNSATGEAMTPPTSDGDSQHLAMLSPTPTANNAAAFTATTTTTPAAYPIETVLPVPPPILPPNNPMRASITPALYLSIYDKVVASSAQPSCPINLADIVRSCVAAWKRDGEWPPRPTHVPLPHPAAAAAASGALTLGLPSAAAAATAAAARAAHRRRRQQQQQQQQQQQEQQQQQDKDKDKDRNRRLSFAGLMGRRPSAAGVDGDALVEPGGIRMSFRKILHIGQHGQAATGSSGGGGGGGQG